MDVARYECSEDMQKVGAKEEDDRDGWDGDRWYTVVTCKGSSLKKNDLNFEHVQIKRHTVLTNFHSHFTLQTQKLHLSFILSNVKY